MGTYLIVGAGTIGSVVAEDLAQQGHAVRILSRHGTGPECSLIERIAGDASETSTVTRHASGTDAVFNCANPPYHRWPTDWPPIADAILAAVEANDSKLVTLNNLYAYGRPNGPMTPHDPLTADYEKAQVRATMWHDAMRAHDEGRIRATEVRASDYIGPRSESYLGLLSEVGHWFSKSLLRFRYRPGHSGGFPAHRPETSSPHNVNQPPQRPPFKPCVRFSHTRLSDIVHCCACAVL